MASMSYVQYVSDDGNTYQRKTRSDVATALGQTTEALGTHTRLPRNIKPRYRLGKDPSGREHKLIIGSATDTLFVSDTTVTYPNPDNHSTTITLNLAGAVAEKRYSR